MDACCQRKQNSVCYSRLNVLFVKHDGNSKQPGGKNQGPGSVTAYPDNQVRSKFK